MRVEPLLCAAQKLCRTEEEGGQKAAVINRAVDAHFSHHSAKWDCGYSAQASKGTTQDAARATCATSTTVTTVTTTVTVTARS